MSNTVAQFKKVSETAKRVQTTGDGAGGALSAMQRLWFRQVQDDGKWGNYQLSMDQSLLADACFNPLDSLRLLIMPNYMGDGLDCAEAAEICEIDEDVFRPKMPTLSREDWERSLGRLTLCLLASMRNEWRQDHGRPDEELENVFRAVEDFHAVAESGFKFRYDNY